MCIRDSLSAIASLQSFSSLLDEKDLLSRSIKKLKKEIVQNENEFAYAEKVAICQTQEKEISKIRDRSEICRVLLQTIAQKKQLLLSLIHICVKNFFGLRSNLQ